jgi:hypothetical protein
VFVPTVLYTVRPKAFGLFVTTTPSMLIPLQLEKYRAVWTNSNSSSVESEMFLLVPFCLEEQFVNVTLLNAMFSTRKKLSPAFSMKQRIFTELELLALPVMAMSVRPVNGYCETELSR